MTVPQSHIITSPKKKYPPYVKSTHRRLGEASQGQYASSAILDRLLHRGHLLKFEGKTYRLKEAASRLSETKQKNQDEKGKNMDLSTED